MSTIGIKTIVAAIAAIASVSASAAITTLDGKGFDLSFDADIFSPSLISLSADRTAVVFDTDAFSVAFKSDEANIASFVAQLTITRDAGYTFSGLELKQSGVYSLMKTSSEVGAALISSVWIDGNPNATEANADVFEMTGVKIGGNKYGLKNTYDFKGTAFATAQSFEFMTLSGLYAEAAYDHAASIYANSYSLSVMTAPVPEPEQWALMLAGIGMVGAIARRRSRRA
ncbi:PEPxxWA-CTERM sorting domain-containing protein [Niveibacterium sp. 24ML]|uniref:PEPxxWA-CTERM sorting domain-containing protein n=1 Tax=Niveibacterium sp. 24ML TaxID=2985512 RepID=UPI002271421A|nr:PEPxxWA-CTERM sorting domain-containing protein [Niveibacterium sp. 24ML]MCX9156652.1 PEPxxWA-CTERM sorting domain-containing protein [Niveibacterium sp. 24ML]